MSHLVSNKRCCPMHEEVPIRRSTANAETDLEAQGAGLMVGRLLGNAAHMLQQRITVLQALELAAHHQQPCLQQEAGTMSGQGNSPWQAPGKPRA